MNRWLLVSLIGAACCCACTLITPHENLTGGSQTPLADGSTTAPDADAGHEQADVDGQILDMDAEPMDGEGGETADADASMPEADADAGAPQTGRSCVGLAGLCGAEDAQGRSCCDVTLIPGGSFSMGSTNAAEGEAPVHAATVSTFSLDVFEVTVGRFRTFWKAADRKPAAGAGAHPKIANSGWKAAWDADFESGMNDLGGAPNATWTQNAGADDALPINHVNWYVAFAFCAWDNGFLPTEAEWEYAAAGGDENRNWPWGDAPSPTAAHAVYCEAGPQNCPTYSRAHVGQRPLGRGRFEQLDLAGSMLEWTLDVHEDSWYAGDGNNCVDCANLSSGIPERTLRGGSWFQGTGTLHVAFRQGFAANGAEYDFGIRCAHTP